MLPPSFRPLAVLLALCLGPGAAVRAEPAIIAKARAYLGPEAALKAVKSVHYTGSMLAPNPANATQPFSVGVDIIFQAPYRQRTVRTTSTLVDTSALDGYDGWQRVQDAKDATRWRLQLLPTDQIKRQRAIVTENLAFYRGLEHIGGSVVDQGLATLDGVACRKIAFIHAPDIIFYRYFAEATGRLMLTETENGSSIREQGEIMVNGIRFPRKITNTVKTVDGKEQTVTITFDTITVNESFPASHFAIPPFSR